MFDRKIETFVQKSRIFLVIFLVKNFLVNSCKKSRIFWIEMLKYSLFVDFFQIVTFWHQSTTMCRFCPQISYFSYKMLSKKSQYDKKKTVLSPNWNFFPEFNNFSHKITKKKNNLDFFSLPWVCRFAILQLFALELPLWQFQLSILNFYWFWNLSSEKVNFTFWQKFCDFCEITYFLKKNC